jgi:anti-anti-sigma regulatory factor
MLRLVVKEQTPDEVLVALYGKVVGTDVGLLEQEGRCHCGAGARLVLELDGVQFIDEAGLALLRRWSGSGLQLRGGSAFLRALLAVEGLEVR